MRAFLLPGQLEGEFMKRFSFLSLRVRLILLVLFATIPIGVMYTGLKTGKCP